MSFRVHRAGADRRFKLSGEVDMAVADGLVEVLQAQLNGGGDLTLDLSELAFIDSTGIHALIRISQRLGGDGRLILESPAGGVARVLEIVGIDRFPHVEIRSPLTRTDEPRKGSSRPRTDGRRVS